MRLFINKM